MSPRAFLKPLVLAFLIAVGVGIGYSLAPSPVDAAQSCPNRKCSGLDSCTVRFFDWTCDDSFPICEQDVC